MPRRATEPPIRQPAAKAAPAPPSAQSPPPVYSSVPPKQPVQVNAARIDTSRPPFAFAPPMQPFPPMPPPRPPEPQSHGGGQQAPSQPSFSSRGVGGMSGMSSMLPLMAMMRGGQGMIPQMPLPSPVAPAPPPQTAPIIIDLPASAPLPQPAMDEAEVGQWTKLFESALAPSPTPSPPRRKPRHRKRRAPSPPSSPGSHRPDGEADESAEEVHECAERLHRPLTSQLHRRDAFSTRSPARPSNARELAGSSLGSRQLTGSIRQRADALRPSAAVTAAAFARRRLAASSGRRLGLAAA